MLALLLDLARLSGVSQLDTDSTELLTRVKLKAANSHCLGSSSVSKPSPWQLIVGAHFSLQKAKKCFTVKRSL